MAQYTHVMNCMQTSVLRFEILNGSQWFLPPCTKYNELLDSVQYSRCSTCFPVDVQDQLCLVLTHKVHGHGTCFKYMRVYTQYLWRFHLVQIVYCVWNFVDVYLQKVCDSNVYLPVCVYLYFSIEFIMILLCLKYHQKDPNNKYHVMLPSYSPLLPVWLTGMRQGLSQPNQACHNAALVSLLGKNALKVKDRGCGLQI